MTPNLSLKNIKSLSDHTPVPNQQEESSQANDIRRWSQEEETLLLHDPQESERRRPYARGNHRRNAKQCLVEKERKHQEGKKLMHKPRRRKIQATFYSTTQINEQSTLKARFYGHRFSGKALFS